MQLKQVILTNFKSYRDETKVFIEDGTTIFVGENGSGKSNFLQAMDFVLGCRHADLNRFTRPRFINNAVDIKSASIEVVLQDSDNVIGEEIRIKRQFSFACDKYYINGSRIQKCQLSYVLEILGFPRSTPYHATSSVQIKELVLSTSAGRLNSFINYLGLCLSRTVMFMKKIFQVMTDYEATFKEIDQLLKNHNPEKIQTEVTRHQEYAALGRMKSALRFNISSLRISMWRTLMADAVNALSLKGTNAQTLHSLKCSITSTKIALEKAESDAFSSKMLLDGLVQTKESLVKSIESVNLSINDLEDNVKVEELNISIGTVDVAGSIQERIKEVENALKIERTAVEDIFKKLNYEEQNRNDLVLILSSKYKFSTSSQKTQWIQTEIGKLKKEYEKNVEAVKRFEKRENAVKNSIVDHENKVKRLDREELFSQNLRKELASMKHKLGELHIEFHNLNSLENVILNEVGVAMNTLKSQKTMLNCKIGNSTFNGMQSVKLILDSWNSTNQSIASRCHGTVLDNIECNDGLNSALEAAVGNRLFSQIVETDTVGTAVLREMKSRNLPGEVVFLPLNRIISPDSPQVRTDGVELLINQLSFPDHVLGAISFLFGRILLCQDLEIATKVAKEFCCVCVTVYGDRVVGSGPMTGGYVDRNVSKRTLYVTYQKLEASYRDKMVMLQNKREEINNLKSNIDSVVAFIQRGEIKIINGDPSGSRKMLLSQLENLKKDENHWAEQIKAKKRANELLLKKKEALEKSFHEDVSDIDAQKQLQAINKKVFELEKAYKQHSLDLNLLMSELSLLKNMVSCSTQKDASKVATSSKCKAIHQKLGDYRTKEMLLSSRMRSVDNEIEQASANLSSTHQKIERLKSELDDLRQRLLRANLNEASLDTSGARDAIKEYDEKIRKHEKIKALELKKTDEQLLNELRSLPLEELQNRLADTTRKLEQVAGTLKLSQRALQKEVRYVQLWKTFDVVRDEHMMLCVMVTKFHSWVQQHVSMTLEQVCSLFTHYFSMMVPNGRGSLHVERSTAEPVLAITGIAMSVLFAGDLDVSRASALSTGQQVVVFMSMVFALMKSQRPCFCVLDEIDQSLTNDRIEGLLNAISDLHHQGHQFLISSHNNGMVSRGQHHFAINFKREKSKIQSVSLTEAISFVERIGDVSRRPSISAGLSSSQSTFLSQMESQSSQQSTVSDWCP